MESVILSTVLTCSKFILIVVIINHVILCESLTNFDFILIMVVVNHFISGSF